MLKINNIVLLIFSIFILSFLGLADAGQESIEVVNLYTISSPEFPEALSHSGLAIYLSDRDLNGVSSSVLKAETWVRENVLSLYPSTPITTILVGDTLLCPKTPQNQNTKLSLTLPSLKNIHHSLTRWGLDTEVKLSVSLSSSPSCFTNALSLLNPILDFLKAKNSTLSLDLSAPQYALSQPLKDTNLIIPTNPKRKLTSLTFPTLPNSAPSTIAQHPQSPPPQNDDVAFPPVGPTMPPCAAPYRRRRRPYGAAAPALGPAAGGLWCVAKPSVPAETLQAAMDYACGEGGAECEEIGPSGRCYSPDTVVAHASYAFNAYWQKHKRNGGTCGFGGTAMLINNDPSFLDCRFILS